MSNPNLRKIHWVHDPDFAERVMADLRAGSKEAPDRLPDPALRQPEVVPSWIGMLRSLLADAEHQFAQRKAEMAAVEARYAAGIDNTAARVTTIDELLATRADYAAWKRGALSYHRAIVQKLREARDLASRR